MSKPGQTIIIKKIKKGGHGHHGGAWKVAYADFVTAMMAFFLLLWLLSATPIENLEGLADYFSPTMGVQGSMGIGFAGGKAPSSEGMSAGDWASIGLIFGSPPSGPIIKMPDKDNFSEDNDPVNFEEITKGVIDAVEKGVADSPFKDSVLIEETPLGLNIMITDQEKRPMFREGTDILEVPAKKILTKIADIVKYIPNYIEISGHTNSTYKAKSADYTAWELSADRANAVRRFFDKVGLPDTQVVRVVGKADNDPVDKEKKEDPVNSRVSILLLKKSMLAYNKQPAPDEIIVGPIDEGLKSYIKIKQKKDAEQPKASPHGEGGAEGGHESKPAEHGGKESSSHSSKGSGGKKGSNH